VNIAANFEGRLDFDEHRLTKEDVFNGPDDAQND
jgi:hypothetical protein